MGAKPKPVTESRVTGTVVQSDEERRALMEQLAAEEISEPAAPMAPMSIAKPSGFSLAKFKSTKSANIAGVEQLLTGLPHHKLSEAKDWSRLHPDDAYWSDELCFVNVPIKGAARDTLHFITEDLVAKYLPSGLVQRFRMALASKPQDKFFLCHVPSTNLDNLYNQSALSGCIEGRSRWVRLASRRDEGIDTYKVEHVIHEDAFPEPTWPTQSLEALIEATFKDYLIDTDSHPGLLRLIGARQADE